jgi:hypothetical protein
MQREVGPQVAPPLFMHQIQQLPPHAAAPKKRGHPWPAPAAAAAASGEGNWNPKMWDWDSRALTARPSSDALRLGGGAAQGQQHQKQQQQPAASAAAKAAEAHRQGAAGNGALNLHLGLREDAATPMDTSPSATVTSSPSPPASAPAAGQEPVVRPSKRVRSGSPGSAGGSAGAGAANGGASYPMCQVDDCRADLTSAKDYHRRHKVCETHSKTTKAVVASQMQRFCQQCSR